MHLNDMLLFAGFLLALETSQSLLTTHYAGDWIVPGANEETENHSEPSDHFKSK